MTFNLNTNTEELKKLLNRFQPITLKEMDHVSLMNRVDTKYIVPIDLLSAIIEEMKTAYRVLDIDGHRVFEYKTEYFDTPEFSMYDDHHKGKLNRFKIRKREYVASGQHYLEIKYKNNKRRTIKKRILKDDQYPELNESHFIEENSPYKLDNLELKLSNRFNRITLVGDDERLTIDFNLSFFGTNEQDADFPEVVIMEFKQRKFNIRSTGIQILKKRHIRPESCSKYCIGAATLHDNIKTNRLKEKIEFLGKLRSDFN